MQQFRQLLIVPCFFILFSAAPVTGFGENQPQPIKIVLGTAARGSGFELFGKHLSEAINAVDPGLQVVTMLTKGSRQNLALLEENKIDMGLVEGNVAHLALKGVGRHPTKLKVLSAMYPNPGMFVVRADSPYKSIEDLKGKRIAFGDSASGLRVLVEDLLDGIGLKSERDFQSVILKKAVDGPRMVLNGEVEALWGAGIGWPGFMTVANGPAGARFIVPTGDQIKNIIQKYPHLKMFSIPAGSYPGQKWQHDSVGLWSQILVSTKVPEEVVYRLAHALHTSRPALAEKLKQARYTNAKVTVAQVPNEYIHLGALRYFNKLGLTQKVCR